MIAVPWVLREGRDRVARSPVRVTVGDSAVVTPRRSPSITQRSLFFALNDAHRVLERIYGQIWIAL